MTDRKKIVGIVVLVVIIGVAAVWLLSSSDRKRYSWYESYRNDQVQPYGTSILFSLLENFFPGKALIESKSPLRNIEKWESPLNYLAVGEDIYYSQDDLWKLLEIVEQGNSALIISKYPPGSLLTAIAEEVCYENFNRTQNKPAARLNFLDSSLKSPQGYQVQYLIKDQVQDYQWNYYDSLWCDTAIVALGTLDTLTNFVKIPYGDGDIFLHSVPLAFSNLHLLEERNLSYVERVLSYLPSADIYWDEHSKIALYDSGGKRGMNSPLQYVLGQPGLRWAWYIVLALVLLYLLTFSKRKQKVIPLLEANENTSIEFTEAIGELYYQQQNHHQLGLLKMRLFLEYIRNHFHLSTNHLDQALIDKISAKSQIPRAQVMRIFDIHKRISNSTEVPEHLLIEFNSALEYFYDNCK